MRWLGLLWLKLHLNSNYTLKQVPKIHRDSLIVYLFLLLKVIKQIKNLKVYVFTAKIDIFLNSNSYVHQLFNANATMYRNSTLLCFAQENMKTVLKSRILFQSWRIFHLLGPNSQKLQIHFGNLSILFNPIFVLSRQEPHKPHRYPIPSSIQPRPLLGLECPLPGQQGPLPGQQGPLPGPMLGQEDFTRVWQGSWALNCLKMFYEQICLNICLKTKLLCVNR